MLSRAPEQCWWVNSVHTSWKMILRFKLVLFGVDEALLNRKYHSGWQSLTIYSFLWAAVRFDWMSERASERESEMKWNIKNYVIRTGEMLHSFTTHIPMHRLLRSKNCNRLSPEKNSMPLKQETQNVTESDTHSERANKINVYTIIIIIHACSSQ